MEMGSNACDTKRQTVRGSGLFYVPIGLQVADDEGCKRDVVHIMNEGYGAWGVLKIVLSNRGLEI